ncbi:hypothetical protein, partial [Desulfococcus sp.]|uniref:hypothetical protein n=1 Tax=Desulfococcus sp. TaxID=2025834 RepID=UPI003D0BE6A4
RPYIDRGGINIGGIHTNSTFHGVGANLCVRSPSQCGFANCFSGDGIGVDHAVSRPACAVSGDTRRQGGHAGPPLH